MSVTDLKILLGKGLKQHPVWFDRVKYLSRRLGIVSPLFQKLQQFQQAHPDAFFIQIGANDGISNDPLREFVVQSKWNGILVEPVPHLFHLLRRNYQKNRRLTFENCAIADQEKALTFYSIKEEALNQLPFYASQIGSFDKAHILKHFSSSSNIEESIIASPIQCKTVGSLMRENGVERIDLLHLDVEGFEFPILESILNDKIYPKVILYESEHLGPDKEKAWQRLAEAGYQLEEIGMDTYACLA